MFKVNNKNIVDFQQVKVYWATLCKLRRIIKNELVDEKMISNKQLR